MTHTHTVSEPWLKWHFLLSQVWVEGEDVDSKPLNACILHQ